MISNKIRDERRNLKLTQKELSQKLKISQPSLASYETGTREPDINILIKLAQIFNCSIDYLVGMEKRQTQPLTNTQKEILELTLSLNNIELIKTKAYIQGLIDNRLNKSNEQFINKNNFNNE